jgi:hypothetical protein
MAIKSIRRVLLNYWEFEKSRPVPDRLAQLAIQADEALKQRLNTAGAVQSGESTG